MPRATLRRPVTVHGIIVNGVRKPEKRHGGTELQRAIADLIDALGREHAEGAEGALRDFLSGDPIESFDRTIAPSVRRDAYNSAARRRYFKALYRRYQLEIPVLVHAVGLDLELPDEAQCLCAIFATAHYLATLNDIDVSPPDYDRIAAI